MGGDINKIVRHFVVGDTHGCGKTVQNLMSRIRFNPESDHVYFLGDYYDGESEYNVQNLFDYLNKYYQPDLNKTGFHLIRDNHEWGIKNNNNLNKTENKIKIKDLPDIIVINDVNNQKFVLCHGGMHKEEWGKINKHLKDPGYSSFQLDISEKDKKSSLYRTIIFPTKGDDTNYDISKDEAADFWPSKDSIENVTFIHGHFPITLEKNMGENYNYRVIKDTKVRYNPIRQAYNIDSGVKGSNEENSINVERALTCVNLEELDIDGDGIYTVPYEKGFAQILDFTWDKLKDKIGEIFDESNKDLNDFINALLNISEVSIDNLPEDKNSIGSDIEKISNYIKNNNSYNFRLNNMFNLNGFTLPPEGTKEYYFFIADLKIQSTVYILRIYNFICSWKDTHGVERRRADFLEEVKNIKLNLLGEFVEKDSIVAKDAILEDLLDVNFIENDTQKEEKNYNEKKLMDLYKEVTSYITNINLFFEDESIDIMRSLEDLATVFKKLKQQKLDQFPITSEENNFRTGNAEEKKYTEIRDKIEEEFSRLPNFEYGIKLFQANQDKFDFMSQDAIEYYLFDNSMKELDFCGIEWEWLWRYECNIADLFRCVGTDNFTYKSKFQITNCESNNDSEGGISGREYYANMIRETVRHMNKGDNKSKLASYSKNPFRDIYKYMNIEKNNNEQEEKYYFIVRKEDQDNYISYLRSGIFDVNNKSSELIQLPYERNTNHVTFALVKNADINIVRKIVEAETGIFGINAENKNFTSTEGDSPYDFSTMITNKISDKGYYAFCLDILDNKAPRQKGGIRCTFQKYTNNFPYKEEAKIKGLQRNVVAPDDKEVVMLGNTCNRITYDLPNDYETCEDNVEYRIKLTSKEMLYLFYEIHKMSKLKTWIRVSKEEYLEGQEFLQYNLCLQNERIPIYVDIPKQRISGQLSESTVDKKANKQREEELRINIEKSIVESIESLLKMYGNNEETDKKIKFIKSFLSNSSYNGKPNYGNALYRADNDTFIRFCREIFLKSN